MERIRHLMCSSGGFVGVHIDRYEIDEIFETASEVSIKYDGVVRENRNSRYRHYPQVTLDRNFRWLNMTSVPFGHGEVYGGLPEVGSRIWSILQARLEVNGRSYEEVHFRLGALLENDGIGGSFRLHLHPVRIPSQGRVCRELVGSTRNLLPNIFNNNEFCFGNVSLEGSIQDKLVNALPTYLAGVMNRDLCGYYDLRVGDFHRIMVMCEEKLGISSSCPSYNAVNRQAKVSHYVLAVFAEILECDIAQMI